MSSQVLTDSELLAKLANMFRDLGGLAAECEARGWQREQQILASAGLGVAVVSEAIEHRTTQLKPWQFSKPNGLVGICSWCQAELNVKPQPGESHGICPRHHAAVLATIPGRMAA